MRADQIPGHPHYRYLRRDRVGNTGRAATRRTGRPSVFPPLGLVMALLGLPPVKGYPEPKLPIGQKLQRLEI